MTETAKPDDADNANVVMFNKDFVAFLVSVALAFMLFTGFAYRAAFFARLGVPLDGELDMSGLLLRGLFLLQDIYVFLTVMVIFCVLLFIYAVTNSAKQRFVHYGAMALMFVGATLGAAELGEWKGRQHATLMVTANYGSPSICAFGKDAKIEPAIKSFIDDLFVDLKLKLVRETKEYFYFAVQLDEPTPNLKGQSIALAKKDIAFCRNIGR